MPEGRDADILRAEDVPGYGQDLNAFAQRFDGYRHFGSDVASARTGSIWERWVESGELPASVDDLRACLWVAVRREKFVEFDDVYVMIGPDGAVVHEPDPSRVTFARRRQEHFKRALATRIIDLLGGVIPSTFMNSQAICDHLSGCTLETQPDYVLSISSSVVRADCDGIPVVAVGNDQSFGAQLNGLLDALHFHRERYRGEGPLRYVVGRRREKGEMDELLAALAGLVEDLRAPIDVTIEVDFTPASLTGASFEALGEHRLEQIRTRDALLKALPNGTRDLEQMVGDPSFRLHLSLYATEFSGRIDGLQVCTLSLDGRHGQLAIGGEGGPDKRRVKKCFRAAANCRDLVTFDSDDLLEAVGILKRLVADRRSGPLSAAEPEHLLEARILRGALPVSSPDGRNLAPASRMGQFPAAYGEAGKARFIDRFSTRMTHRG